MTNLRIEKQFLVPVWDMTMKRKALTFWSRRGVVFTETRGDTLTGRRGSWVGNLTSFDMSKLITRITIDVSAANVVQCVLEINPIFQMITERNQAWWDLEMETFESFLLRDDEQKERWEKYHQLNRKGVWLWVLSRGVYGNKMPPDDQPPKR